MQISEDEDQKWIMHLEDLLDKPASEVLNLIKKSGGRNLKELKICELVFDHSNKPIITGNGVYIFSNDEEPLYVGSSAARPFVERIPAHYDIRGNWAENKAWMNAYLKHIIKRKYNNVENLENFKKAFKFAMKTNLKLINIKKAKNNREYNKPRKSMLEKFLRVELKPKYNELERSKYRTEINKNKIKGQIPKDKKLKNVLDKLLSL